MNPHKIYAVIIIAILVIGSIVGVVAVQHFKDDARRDAVIDEQKSGIQELGKQISESKAAAAAQISQLEKQKQVVIQQPQQAPQIIRELIPTSQPIQQTQPITKDTPPDAPSAVLTKQQEIELAQFAQTCKQCSIERDEFKAEVAGDQQIIAKQNTELDAAMKAAKGGSVWQRSKRVLEWVIPVAAATYALGRAHK